eukprot:CAMPEP_0174825554 /NCGR_PEP_ID=MMETSP1107-20130205/42875_1 /TAXON_ID=36770 /ORGANISM="Paraphysomonas vestita, Strain GFlagA" /LENGTH=84 /DNA_ID=CAMNT_0016057281 /DNA_START=761 /DNA_END=1015 /DNA_ORIENTATION=+
MCNEETGTYSLLGFDDIAVIVVVVVVVVVFDNDGSTDNEGSNNDEFSIVVDGDVVDGVGVIVDIIDDVLEGKNDISPLSSSSDE